MRLKKMDEVFEALGALDELNCLIGLCRIVAARASFRNLDAAGRSELLRALRAAQENLFVIQAGLAGAKKVLSAEKVVEIERTIAVCAERFPPVHSFVIPGATELGAQLDIARSVARRAERLYLRHARRRTTAPAASPSTAGAYLNRLSSLLFVLARLANHAQGVAEETPTYH